MKIRIISPGKIREKYLREAIESARNNLLRKMPEKSSVELVEVEDSPDNWPVDRAMQAEAERIRARLLPSDYIVALDLDGQWPKPDQTGTIAPDLKRWLSAAGDQDTNLVFLIGGSNGLDSTLKQAARSRLCLSKMTYTHQMARLILLDMLEQAWAAYSGS